ncbi:hypothetical protein LOZ39_004288 [Ophidiomyces ophidiicola]|uniref:uncharacterized protein n=1 Tax=Ophidiomyces ophidiicola TaxID=1387563 RepID=UPI0020C41103|nr:uncharacterized protein LOZ57_004609 [Ophidiomyces ophidiicola]KAI1912637.1 hypothetical protein LOZ64_004347 [Ophidiomyces ophidiicola]KAI1944936.1 hypothetical protein LOZ57_004609 [Ophidiomyces ophidiicola]KAI2007479.1 hypothetical protein LOZ50_002579 [Ophidiomyces ophidiicola]KAI2011954.1 hypothetical protein LOZ49_002900 [Ophidiomyces ophidiicola]KAI2019531.1 hypothetical protein LOZ46_003356 [Ophidiomyces ophidiicola]
MDSPSLSPMERPPPTTTAIVVATAILAGVAGYFIGQGASIGLFGSSKSAASSSLKNDKHNDSEEEEEEDSEDEGGELATFEGNTEEVKLVLAVRTDLGMSKGKIAAQCSHATLACYKHYLVNSPNSPILKRWERGGQAKIALQVKSEEDMLLLQAQALSLGLCARVIQDAGRTQIARGSRTVLGVLGPKSVVDKVTGHLKLL